MAPDAIPLLCFLGALVLAGLGWGLSEVVPRLMALRGPANLIAGHVYPHPRDERWQPGSVDYFQGFIIGDLVVSEYVLKIGGVTLARGARPARLYREIRRHRDLMVLAAAHEKAEALLTEMKP